jgi:hypothetical protein
VKGQNGDPGNERADVLATSARLNTDSESRAYIGDVSAVDLALARRQNVASERRITSRRMRDKRRVKRAHPRRLRALVLVADGRGEREASARLRCWQRRHGGVDQLHSSVAPPAAVANWSR